MIFCGMLSKSLWQKKSRMLDRCSSTTGHAYHVTLTSDPTTHVVAALGLVIFGLWTVLRSGIGYEGVFWAPCGAWQGRQRASTVVMVECRRVKVRSREHVKKVNITACVSSKNEVE